MKRFLWLALITPNHSAKDNVASVAHHPSVGSLPLLLPPGSAAIKVVDTSLHAHNARWQLCCARVLSAHFWLELTSAVMLFFQVKAPDLHSG